ncbi:MAG: flagellar basal body P-ring formation chaperone FlgA [Pirellula sp.]|jgi:flagella basal body P-ring formation protein FlgA
MIPQNGSIHADSVPLRGAQVRTDRRWEGQRWSSVRCCVLTLAFMCVISSSVRSDEPVSPTLRLKLREQIKIHTNLIRLSDLCELSGTDEMVQSLGDLPIAPSPRQGVQQQWTRGDLEKAVSMRGINAKAIRWSGAEVVQVQRLPRLENVPLRNELEVQTASAQTAVVSDEMRGAPSGSNTRSNPPGKITESASSVPQEQRAKFTPAFTTSVSTSQAERMVVAAIESYLQLKTGGNGKWGITPHVPTEMAPLLLQRRQILGVSGGEPPWDGDQQFTLLVRTAQGETTVDIRATVRLPDMVVAAKGPLAKGRIVQESDLVWQALPPTSSISMDECFSDFENLVGKQLRRAVSTKQPIRRSEVSEPSVVQAGEMVTIAVIAGSVLVETPGRAVESGAIDDVIQVEVLPQRKRVTARVAAERRVEVISNGAPMVTADAKNPRQSTIP